MKNSYSKSIADAIHQFLTGDDWHFSFDEDAGIFSFGLNLHCKLKNIRYKIRVRDDSFVTYAVCPLNADEDDASEMQRMAEFIARANYGLLNGNFEFDFRDGEIRYKSYADCEDILPSRAVIKNSIYCTAAMFKRYAPGILDILFTDTSAKDAVDKCEDRHDDAPEAAGDTGDASPSAPASTESLIARLAERFGVDPSTLSGGGQSDFDTSGIISDLFPADDDTDDSEDPEED